MDWSNAFWAALVAGIVMGGWAMMMHMLGVSRMSMTSYEGCMITGDRSGGATFAAGMAMHLMISILIGFIYAWAFETIFGESGWLYGLIGGLVHWLVAGMMLPLMDNMNGCVKRDVVQPMRWFASGYGGGAVATFLIGHLLFGLVFGLLYTVAGT